MTFTHDEQTIIAAASDDRPQLFAVPNGSPQPSRSSTPPPSQSTSPPPPHPTSPSRSTQQSPQTSAPSPEPAT